MAVYESNISSSNADKLQKLWDLKTHGYVTAKPLLDGNRVFISYFHGYIYCLKANDGTLIYKKQLYQPPTGNPILMMIPLVNQFLGEPLPYMWNGFAGTGCISDGIWYLASVGGKEGSALKNGAGGRLYAVHTYSGTVLWERSLGENEYSGSLAVPVCDDNNLYIGLCSVDEVASVTYKLHFKSFTPQCTGEVFCFNKYSGNLIWRKRVTKLIPGDDSNSKGAGVWGGFSVDTTSGALYFATGNSYGRPVSKISDSVVCVDSSNGSLRWSSQVQTEDAWMPLKRDGPDFDFGCTPIPFPCSSANSGFAVGAGNKNGFIYAFDLGSGKLIWKTFCHINSSPDDGIRSNITFKNGRIFIWSKNATPRNFISVICINSQSGKIIWNKIVSGTNNMTTGAVTNDLYFMANYSGELFALSTSDGERVWVNKGNRVSLGSDLTIWKSRIYAGFGVPKLYGGRFSPGGVICYGF